jgi:hypothetical protein
MSLDHLFTDELPPEAKALIEAAEQDLQHALAHTETEVAQVQARADRAVERARQTAAQAIAELRERATQERTERVRRLLEELKPMQVAYVKEGKLDEALAIRDRVRQFRTQLVNARPDPGTLRDYGPADDGTELLFEVTGNTDGTIWGTDVYTGDSPLAVAAVHAGLVRPGERGIVRVTIVDGLNVAFTGSHQNGVWSEDYEDYPIGYRLSRA